MISIGIGMAAAVRIGYAVGRNDGPGVNRAGLVPMLLGIVSTAILPLGVIAARFEIAELFLSESAGDADATIQLTPQLILVGASFFISDTVESIAASALRGLNDTRVPLLFALIAYWLIGFPLSYVLSLKIGLSAMVSGLARSAPPCTRRYSSGVSCCWQLGSSLETILDCLNLISTATALPNPLQISDHEMDVVSADVSQSRLRTSMRLLLLFFGFAHANDDATVPNRRRNCRDHTFETLLN